MFPQSQESGASLSPSSDSQMMIEERMFELHREAHNLAFAYYIRKGFIPFPLPEIISATTSLETFLKYNPDEPRVPAGNPDGGQWTTGGGGDDTNGDNTDGSGAGSNSPTDKPTASSGSQEKPQLIPASATGGNNSKPDSFDPTNQNPPIPDYKKDSVNQADWDAFNQQLTKMQQNGEISPTEAYAYREIFAAEGGMSQAPDSTAVAGILQSNLTNIRNAADNGNVAAQNLVDKLDGIESVADLKPNNVANIYQYYMNNSLHTVGGSAVLNSVGDPYAAATLADTLFRSGSAGGATIAQNAINNVYADTGHPPIPVDGQMGPQTLADYSSLARNSGTLDDLLDNRTRLRERAAPGESSRFEHFRFVRERGLGI